MQDKAIEKLIIQEKKRQKKVINLIASENFVSSEVLKALASPFINKYAEGYPKHRYYGGTQIADRLEILVQKRALKLFHLSPQKWGVNVQPYSGSPANLAIYFALVPFGEKIMGMSLEMGGHLSHIQKVSITGNIWKQVAYGVDPKTEMLNYEEIRKIAKKEKPKLLIAGFTAYPRIINFKKMRAICDEVNAFLMVDMSHFAGLVAGGVYPSPFPYAQVVMTTTHKTLRGPRAAMIFARKEPIQKTKGNNQPTFYDKINKAVFPGLQGGPHLNTIASLGVALYEAKQKSFKKYARQVVKNARVLALEFQKLGFRVISSGTDTHLLLLDTISSCGLSGKEAEKILEKNGIIVNKNTIPYDSRKPFDPSGIRLGTPAVTGAGMKEKEMKEIARRIAHILKQN
jgi:glycine hydroxymethyltransferase